MLPTTFFGHLRRGCAAVAAGLLLASCGGGEEVVDPFVPTRVLAFGDELSTIEADGRKYSINAFRVTDATTTPPTESTTELDCTRNPVWTQAVATGFGLPFDRCLGTATTAGGQMLARAGQKVGDLAAQIAAVQGAALNDKDLALVMLGMNDVLELYAQYPTRTQAALLAEAEARGVTLGQQINALALRGPAVVVLTMLDVGLTPFALNENTTTGDTGRAAFLTQLTNALNDSMSVTLINDGRLIGLAQPEIELRALVKLPASGGFTNVVGAACRTDTPLPGCTTATLDTGASATAWLWADSLRPGPAMQSRMGTAAFNRARTNPF